MPSAPREPSHAAAVGVLAALALPLVLFDLGSYGLVDGDEGFYHYVARNMLRTGDWFRLEFAGEHRLYDTFTHAPLFFWLKAPVIAALGDGYWSMRLVSASFAALGVLATYALACRLLDRRFALLAGLLQWTTFQFVYLHCGRTGEMEPVIACVTTLAALAFLRATQQDRSFVPHHLLLAALLMLKAALVVVPLLAELLFFAVSPAQRSRARAWLAQGLRVLPFALAWHLFQLLRNWDGFTATLAALWIQAGGAEAPHGGPASNAGYYLLTLLWGGFPHALLYPLGLAALVRRRRAAAPRLLLLLAGTWYVYFCLVALRQPWYITPLYPLLCIAVARWLADLELVEASRLAAPLTAAALAIAPFVHIDYGLNPFATRSTQLRDRVSASSLLPAETWPWLLASAGLAAAIAFLLGRRLRAHARGAVLIASAWLLVPAGLRVVLPLRHTHTVTPIERLARSLAERRARGDTIDYPVPLANWGELRIRYFFADDYALETVSVPTDGGRRVVHRLVGERPPRRAPPRPPGGGRGSGAR